MTILQKFDYIKSFSTLNIFGDIYYAIPIKDKKKRESSLQKSYYEIEHVTKDIYIKCGYFVLDRSVASPHEFINIGSPKQVIEYFNNLIQYMEFTSSTEKIKTLCKKHAIDAIEEHYNTLIEFENKVKQLNGG